MANTFATYNPEEATQARVQASYSNPNTPAKPQAPTQAMQQTKPQTINDPANNWVMPEQNPYQFQVSNNVDVTKLNTSLLGASLTPAFWNPDTLENYYGVSGGGFKETDVAKLPWAVTNQKWDLFTKVSTAMVNENNEKYNELVKDLSANQGLTPDKPANSWRGIDINFWYSLDKTEKLMMQLAANPDLARNRDLWKWAWDNFIQAWNAYQMALKQIQKWMPYEQINQILAEPVGTLKMAMIPIVEKANWIEYWSKWRTLLWDTYNDFIKSMDKYTWFYQSSGKELEQFVNNVKSSQKQYLVEYKQLKDQGSINAKQNLLKNSAYQWFLQAIVKQRPELWDKLRQNMNEPTITQFEQKLIDDYFVGGYAKQLFTARSNALKQFWPMASSWFKPFDEILNVKELRYQTAEDDYLSSMNLGQIDYSKYGWLDFGIGRNPSNSFSSVKWGWQSKSSGYTSGYRSKSYQPTYG